MRSELGRSWLDTHVLNILHPAFIVHLALELAIKHRRITRAIPNGKSDQGRRYPRKAKARISVLQTGQTTDLQ